MTDFLSGSENLQIDFITSGYTGKQMSYEALIWSYLKKERDHLTRFPWVKEGTAMNLSTLNVYLYVIVS